MKILKIIFLFCLISFNSLTAQESCLSNKNLKQIDLAWEKAQLNSDVDFFENNLSKNFVWTHNNAKTIDNKDAVINRAKRYLKNKIKYSYSRTTEDVSTVIYGKTGIVNGFTVVLKTKDAKPVIYHFMRTYSEKNGKCILIANHTMAVDKTKW
ncbi:nuclear transport factor 2 family protein [Polaribacter vadi]|uniref:nuclear transport factor 2 family protein n=1 Tax=Polaribacter TaxID=52959 RepID=UPI001C097AA6|nr:MULTISPECIES: nuclear transport factor 2 family protein [Polaribacter]MBU3009916.1 nuclear transport factor 2 family protein [Polaribacter vadi]MDO6739722.1 nuclear transport factor 2 family protein [Polaribacter sp. 1_MG-2023]